jgi:hypothetical protein
MECLSCNEEVSARFVHALASNACPFCGQHIMAPELQASLNSLREVMTDIGEKGYIAQAEAWLRSNFDLVSTNSDEYHKLTDELSTAQASLQDLTKELEEMKKQPLAKNPAAIKLALDKDGKPIQVEGQVLSDPSKINTFFQRAQATRSLGKTNEVKEAIAKVKMAAMSGSGIDPIAAAFNMPIEEDDPIDVYESDEPLDALGIGDQLAALGSGGGGSGGYNAKDVQSLKIQQAKVAQAARRLAGTGSAGLISRSG